MSSDSGTDRNAEARTKRTPGKGEPGGGSPRSAPARPGADPSPRQADAGRRGDTDLDGTILAQEFEALDDAEMAEVVREAFRTEVGEALDDVRIVCRGGRVILAGEVASETLAEIARRIVEDEVGYEVVDRMLVTDSAGGPDAMRASEKHHAIPDDTLSLDEEDLEVELSEDILETEEEGLVFVPPTRPVPER